MLYSRYILKTSLTLLWILPSLLFAQVQHGLKGIIVEKYYVADAKDAAKSAKHGGKLKAGAVTYRIYVDMLPGYKFESAFGTTNHPLRIATTTYFYNNDKGGSIANSISQDHLKDNTVMLDSWLSAGAASEGNWGILKANDNGVGTIVSEQGLLQNEDTAAGIPLKKQDGLLAGTPPAVTTFGIDTAIKVFDKGAKGSIFSTTYGAWATVNGASSPDSSNNRVLIAQLTTNGQLSFELNIQIGKPLIGKPEQYVARNPRRKHEVMLPTLTYPPVTDQTSQDVTTK